MLPSEARKSWISYDSNTVQNWITHHPKPKSPHRVHLLGRITGRIGLQRIFSIWAHEADPLCKNLFEAPGNYMKNSKEQRECWSKKCEKYLRRHKKSWRFTARLQQLTISRLGASERVGPWFLPLNYCGRGENPKTECLLHHPCDLYIILQIGAHHPIPNVTATLKPTLALTTLESGSEMQYMVLVHQNYQQNKSAQTLAKSNGLSFNLGLQKSPP